MKKTLIGGCVSLLALSLLSGGVSAATLLTGAEIQALLAGKTVAGIAGENIPFTKTYRADGTFTLQVENGEPRNGTWRVNGDQYCQIRIEIEECYSVEKDGDTYRMLYDGDQVHTTFNLQ
ncbi:MAG: hypothetical protein AB1568_07850 [Thermodesulfobacteriota bacterium]